MCDYPVFKQLGHRTLSGSCLLLTQASAEHPQLVEFKRVSQSSPLQRGLHGSLPSLLRAFASLPHVSYQLAKHEDGSEAVS